MRYCYFSYSRNCSAQNEKMRDNENNSRLPLIRPFFADHQYSRFPVQTLYTLSLLWDILPDEKIVP